MTDTAASVWVLIIEHRHGVDSFVHQTEQGAKDHLLAYVDEWWSQEMPDQAPPSDVLERISDYFENVDSEDYILTEAAVLP